MSEVKKPSQLSSASSLDGLSLLAADAAGSMKTLSSKLFLPAYFSNELTEDCDKMRTAGIYTLSASCENQPCPGSGKALVVIPVNSATCYQICLRAGNGGELYFRAYTSNVWQSWHQIV